MTKLTPNTEACKTCTVGSCCYEGTELTAKELRTVIKLNPNVPKPWFAVIPPGQRDDPAITFETVIRDGTCVFQDKDNRCLIYKGRPQFCRDFPVEDGEAAPYYKRLCVLYADEWGPNASVRKIYKQREKK